MTQGLEEVRVGFLGGGAMGEALAAGVLAAGVPASCVRISDPDPARRDHLASAHGVAVHDDNDAVVEASGVVVLAVKPALARRVLAGLRAVRDATRRPLWISIAAGVPLATLEGSLPAGARVVRAMPNTPALVGSGATAFVANAAATARDRAVARSLFESVGKAWEAPAEALLDAVTGVSGSGPAYAFVFLEALSDAGVRMGLPRAVASDFAIQTLLGAARLAQETGQHPAALKDQVTSPGGTTIEALERLEAGGFRAALHAAVAAACQRARELGDG